MQCEGELLWTGGYSERPHLYWEWCHRAGSFAAWIAAVCPAFAQCLAVEGAIRFGALLTWTPERRGRPPCWWITGPLDAVRELAAYGWLPTRRPTCDGRVVLLWAPEAPAHIQHSAAVCVPWWSAEPRCVGRIAARCTS